MKSTPLFLALGLTALSAPALADNHGAGMSAERPSRGMNEQVVEARFGAPAAKVSPVGEPPISRWEYSDYIVYFEYDKVIHAVNRRR
jgi:hypothetical protein